MAKKTTVETPGVVKRVASFAQDVKNETDKVTWPSQEDLKASTTVVIMFLFLLAAIIGGLDVVFQNAVLMLFRLT